MRGVAKIAEISRDRITGQAQRRLKYCCVGGVNVLLGSVELMQSEVCICLMHKMRVPKMTVPYC